MVGAALLGWYFVVAKQAPFGGLIPVEAFMRPTQAQCEEVRQSVEMILGPDLTTVPCKDGAINYIGVPIHGK